MYSFAEAGPVRRVVRMAVTSRPVAWLSVRLLPGVDRTALRLTGGRTTFSAWVSGLPVVRLTTTGARSGRSRTTPVLGIPDGERLVVIASNFGGTSHPAWYHNVRAHPAVVITTAGRSAGYTASELTGDERDRWFAAAVRMNPGWLRYEKWAGSRRIPVLRLDPVLSGGQSPPR